MPKNTLPPKDVIKFISDEGKASTSFLTLYSGFSYFQAQVNGRAGMVAYIENKSVWVAGSDPILAKEDGKSAQEDLNDLESLLLLFFKEAQSKHKKVVMLPVSKEIADRMRAKGFFALQIGSEPWFSLKSMSHPKSDLIDRLNVARQLTAKGVTVEKFNPNQLNAREHLELEELTRSWYGSRKMTALHFLNRVEPWIYVEHKTYFRMIYNGRQVGYLAAIPALGSKSWYCADLIRSPDCPLGTTELLIAEALQYFKNEGFEEVSLGMATLASISSEEVKFHPRKYKAMQFAFERFNLFYNFKSLFLYKEKLKPTHWETCHLITSSHDLGFRGLFGLMGVILPQGIMRAFFDGLWRKRKDFNLERVLMAPFSDEFALRTLPKSFFGFLERTKIMLSLMAINFLFFVVANDANGNLRPRFSDTYSYQWSRLLRNAFQLQSLDYLILPSFLHFNYVHIIFNTTLLVFVVGLLEILAGSTFMGITFLMGMLFSNLFTTLVFMPWIHLLSPRSAAQFANELDVGASLGIFSGLAAFIYFLKYRKIVFAGLIVAVIVAAFAQSSLLALNHLIALAMGYFIARSRFPAQKV